MSEQDQGHSRYLSGDDPSDDQGTEAHPGAEGSNLRDDFGILSAFLAASSHGDDTNGTIQSSDGRVSISIAQLLSYLTSRNGGGSRDLLAGLGEDEEDGDYIPDDDDDDDEYEEEEDEDNEGYYMGWENRHFNAVGNHFPEVTVPVAAGLKLLYSGEFGPPPPGPVTNLEQEEQKPQSKRATRRARRSLDPTPRVEANQYPAHHTTYRLPMSRIRTPFAPRNYRVEAGRGLVPNSSGAIVAQYEDRVYSGQFSLDANIYYSCTQGHDIWVYDANSTGDITTHPQTGHKSRMDVMNRVKGIYGNWTVTDSHLSPDNERLIYSSISPVIHLTKLHEPNAQHIPLDFSSARGRNRRFHGLLDDSFGIWTCRFSADGKEVVACGSHQIFVWDLAAHKRIVDIPAHRHDVNSCCWADTASGNVLISGSDDTMIKVWDRRSLSSNRPSGVLPGHTEGITNVSAKGDGRYIISNGKDHALRLWDLRMMREDEEVVRGNYGQARYDYRFGNYKKPKWPAHPQDCSVMTYRGHSVFRTLIRCHFSPAETTGQAYIYSGSTDGKVYIWSLDGRIVQTLDRTQTLPITYNPLEPDLPLRPAAHRSMHNDMIIRDCSWHPREPALLSCYWHRDESSSIGRHEWKSLGKRGLTLEDVVEKERQDANEQWARTNLFAAS